MTTSEKVTLVARILRRWIPGITSTEAIDTAFEIVARLEK